MWKKCNEICKKSHLFKKNKEINFSPRNTNIIKGSTENKIGHLYKDRKIDFKKKVETSRLYKKEHFILFYGDLIHGNAKNLTNKTRISLDLRFLFKKHMKYNPVQGITKKNILCYKYLIIY